MKSIDKLSRFDGAGSIAAIWLDGQLINAIDHTWEIQDCPLGVKIESVVFLRKRRLIDRVGTVQLQPLSGCQLFRNSVQHNLKRLLLAFFSSFSQHLILYNSLFNVICLGFPVLWPWENTGNFKTPKNSFLGKKWKLFSSHQRQLWGRVPESTRRKGRVWAVVVAGGHGGDGGEDEDNHDA